MERKGRYFTVAVTALALLWAGSSMASAETPTNRIKGTISQVRSILQDPGNQGEARIADRRDLLRQAIIPRFEFPDMARRSLGRHWRNLNGKRDEFVAVFTDYLEKIYVSQIESLRDEKIVYVRERTDADYAQVDTKVVPSKGEPFFINYRMRRIGSEWKIYDLIIENVSIVNNYRSQFSRFLTRASVGELLKTLRAKGSNRES